jgi:hypothetical protein
MPISELEFLDEGLQELKLLNWMQLPASLFEIITGNNEEEEIGKILQLLESIFTFNRKGNSNIIIVYPQGLTRY